MPADQEGEHKLGRGWERRAGGSCSRMWRFWYVAQRVGKRAREFFRTSPVQFILTGWGGRSKGYKRFSTLSDRALVCTPANRKVSFWDNFISGFASQTITDTVGQEGMRYQRLSILSGGSFGMHASG